MTAMTTSRPAPVTEPAPAPHHGDDDVIHIVVDWAIAHWFKCVVLGRTPVPLCGADLTCETHPACSCNTRKPTCAKCLVEDAFTA